MPKPKRNRDQSNWVTVRIPVALHARIKRVVAVDNARPGGMNLSITQWVEQAVSNIVDGWEAK